MRNKTTIVLTDASIEEASANLAASNVAPVSEPKQSYGSQYQTQFSVATEDLDLLDTEPKYEGISVAK